MLAATTALVVVVHHALADQPRIHARADGVDDAARLVTGDHRRAAAAEAQARRGVAGGPVRVEIAAAHPGGLDRQDDFTGPGCRIGELAQLELAIAEEYDPAHAGLLGDSAPAYHRVHYQSAMTSSIITEAVRTLVERRDLTRIEAAAAMEAIMSGAATNAQIAAFLTALRMKG